MRVLSVQLVRQSTLVGICVGRRRRALKHTGPHSQGLRACCRSWEVGNGSAAPKQGCQNSGGQIEKGTGRVTKGLQREGLRERERGQCGVLSCGLAYEARKEAGKHRGEWWGNTLQGGSRLAQLRTAALGGRWGKRRWQAGLQGTGRVATGRAIGAGHGYLTAAGLPSTRIKRTGPWIHATWNGV